MNTKIVKLEKVNRGHLLNQKIYKIIKSQILEGNLDPGTKLVGEKLAEQMGVSRTPIREAIKWLAVEGFVNTINVFQNILAHVTTKGDEKI